MPQLVGLRGTHWGQTLPLGTEITLGRDAANQVSFPQDSSVSRHHARIFGSTGGYAIEDLGSSNGTFVNGIRISATTSLNSGDEIAIGSQGFRFEMPPAAVPLPPRRQELSRGEQAAAFTRGVETPRMPDLSGCAAPRLDLPDISGCLRFLMLMLIALAVLLVIGVVIGLAGAGIGMLGGLGGAAGAGTGGGTTTGGGQPPKSGPPPESQSKDAEGIRVVSSRIVPVWDSAEGKSHQQVLVTWENATKRSVSRIWARVRVLDAAGAQIGEAARVEIYSGSSVAAGERHSDIATADQGFPVPPSSGAPASVEIIPTEYQ